MAFGHRGDAGPDAVGATPAPSGGVFPTDPVLGDAVIAGVGTNAPKSDSRPHNLTEAPAVGMKPRAPLQNEHRTRHFMCCIVLKTCPYRPKRTVDREPWENRRLDSLPHYCTITIPSKINWICGAFVSVCVSTVVLGLYTESRNGSEIVMYYRIL